MLRTATGFIACAFALFALFASPGVAQQRLRIDLEYRVIDPQPVSVADGIEVIDFFWYGCPHCNNLQPALERWISRKPTDVTVRRIPAILRDSWAPHARIYYTLEALGEAEHLHQRVYHSYHVEKLFMSKPDIMAEWAARNGISRERWNEAYGSSAVQRKVEEAAKLTRAYKITGTPSLVVQGHYQTSGGMAETLDGLILILDGLIALERRQPTPR